MRETARHEREEEEEKKEMSQLHRTFKKLIELQNAITSLDIDIMSYRFIDSFLLKKKKKKLRTSIGRNLLRNFLTSRRTCAV